MQTHTFEKKHIVLFIGVFLVALAGFIGYSYQTFGAVNKDVPASRERFVHSNFFASSTAQITLGKFATTTATTTGNVFTNLQVNAGWGATSTNITPFFDSEGRRDDGSLTIAGAKKVLMYFKRGDTAGRGNTGTTTFRVQVTPDGTNWFDFNKLVAASSTAYTVASSVIASFSAPYSNATSTQVLALDLEDEGYLALRCIINATSTSGGGNILPDGEHSCAATVEW